MPAAAPAPETHPIATRRAGRCAWLGLAVLALPCFVYAMDLTVLNLAVPAISADLHPGGAAALWLVDIYGFMVAGALVTMGALGDRIGARRLLLVGAGAFASASLLAAFAPTTATLIAARAVLGLAGATIAPSTLSLISRLFADDGQRRVAIGIWVASYSLGAAIGPVAGGVLLEAFGWRSIFALGLPVMALLLVAGPRLLPGADEGARAEGAGGRLDVASAALSLAAVLSVVFGLKELATGASAAVAAASAAAGLLLGRAFVRRQLRLANPLIDLRLFRVPSFSVALGSNLVTFFVLGGMALFVGQYLQAVLGLSPIQAGLWMVPEALGFVAAGLLAPRLADRMPGPALLAASSALGAIGYLVVAGGGGSLASIVAGTTIGGLGLSIVITLVTDTAVGAVPPTRAGAAAATSETSSELGLALGLALLGSLGTAIFRAGLPAGAPATIGAAVHTGDVAMAASDAFARALSVTASVSGVLLLATAAAVIAVLGRPHLRAARRAAAEAS